MRNTISNRERYLSSVPCLSETQRHDRQRLVPRHPQLYLWRAPMTGAIVGQISIASSAVAVRWRMALRLSALRSMRFPTMTALNWSLAIPEIVLALLAMGILVFGVLWKRGNPSLACAMLGLGALLLTAVLVVSAADGQRLWRAVRRRPFRRVHQGADPGGRRHGPDPGHRLQRENRHRPFRIPRPHPALHCRHDGHGVGDQPDVVVYRARAAIPLHLRHGRLQPR